MPADRNLKQSWLKIRDFFLVAITLSLFNVTPVIAQMSTQFLDNDISNWRLVTDGVMGGVSKGTVEAARHDNKNCIALTGTVSTDNNGGFIQIAYDVDKQKVQNLKQLNGIQLEVRGNGENYNLHLRTSDLWFPWQAFRATFQTDGDWQTIRIPFDSFEAYKTTQALKLENLKRIGVVAIGRDCTSSDEVGHSAPDLGDTLVHLVG